MAKSEKTTPKKTHSHSEKVEHKTTSHAAKATHQHVEHTAAATENTPVAETASHPKKDKAAKFQAPKLTTKLGVSVLIALIVLGGAVAVGLTVWTAYSPQYSYYQMYQSVKKKDFNKFVQYLDLDTMASNVATEQSFYLQGKQADEDMVRIQLKGQIEYTFLKMMKDGTLEEVMPARPSNVWEAYRNGSFSKNGSEYQFNFGKSSKPELLEGISGYKTAELKNQGGRWEIVRLKDNPTLEQEKKQFQSQQQSAQTQQTQPQSQQSGMQVGQ